MKLVSMKREDAAEDLACCAMPMERYGYGLRLYLDGDACEALGITKALHVGTELTLQAKAVVTQASEMLEGGSEGNDISLSVQITDMGVNVSGVMRNAGALLYGSED